MKMLQVGLVQGGQNEDRLVECDAIVSAVSTKEELNTKAVDQYCYLELNLSSRRNRKEGGCLVVKMGVNSTKKSYTELS